MNSTKLLSIKQFSEEFGIDVRVARRAVQTGQIPSLRIGSRDWIPRAALERVLDCDRMIKQTSQ